MWFWESQEDTPPPPQRSAVFVMRNGRYEPQNLMPVLPRPDILDFDGFVVRRGNSAGINARPPDMRQASLVKNPVSIRRDSATSGDLGDGQVVLSFVFDALKSGTISVYLLVKEVECSNGTGPQCERRIDLVPQNETEEVLPLQSQGGATGSSEAGPVTIDPTEPPKAPPPVDIRQFKAGLGQHYESPPLDLRQFPADALAFDPSRKQDIPVAVRLQSDQDPGEDMCYHYTYISLVKGRGTDDKPQWNVWAQKLQYGNQCFVLHEVFGVSPKMIDVEVEASDCVICLSEPRDTAVLPCRHMCFCSYCAGIMRLQVDKCPVCRQKVVSLLQFKRDNVDKETQQMRGLPPAAAAGPAASASSSAEAASSAGPACASAVGPATPADDPFLVTQPAAAA